MAFLFKFDSFLSYRRLLIQSLSAIKKDTKTSGGMTSHKRRRILFPLTFKIRTCSIQIFEKCPSVIKGYYYLTYKIDWYSQSKDRRQKLNKTSQTTSVHNHHALPPLTLDENIRLDSGFGHSYRRGNTVAFVGLMDGLH
jgi:hypothetical protein